MPPVLLAETSALRLILEADIIVQLVMIVLMAMSVVSWAIIGQRFLILRRAWLQSVDFLELFWQTASLDEANKHAARHPESPVAHAFAAGYRELVRINEVGGLAGQLGTDNIARALRKAGAESLTRLERSIPFLASCGSAAPFIGLFGTVWGILRAFQEIGVRGTTSIAEVGPFIAEALIATAVGLFAAIPAVLFFNYFATRLKLLAGEVNNFSMDFLNLVERHHAGRGQ